MLDTEIIRGLAEEIVILRQRIIALEGVCDSNHGYIEMRNTDLRKAYEDREKLQKELSAAYREIERLHCEKDARRLGVQGLGG